MPLDFNFAPPKTEPMYRSQVPPEQLQGLTEYLEKIHNEYITNHSEKVAMSLRNKYKVILLFASHIKTINLKSSFRCNECASAHSNERIIKLTLQTNNKSWRYEIIKHKKYN